MLISADGNIKLSLVYIEQTFDYISDTIVFYIRAFVPSNIDIADLYTVNDWVFENTSLRLFTIRQIEIEQKQDEYYLETLGTTETRTIFGPRKVYVNMALGIDRLDILRDDNPISRALRTEDGRRIVSNAMVDKELSEAVVDRELLEDVDIHVNNLDPLSEF